jgi:CRISP-associated protein Cas1
LDIKKDNQKTKKRRDINEVKYLIPLSRRHPIYYLEHCKIIRQDNDIRVLQKNDDIETEITLPVANIGALLLGPGCSITTEAARIATSRGCLLCFTGGGSSPLFMISSQHRSPLPRIRQMNTTLNEQKRKIAAEILFMRRKKIIEDFKELNLPPFPNGDEYSTISMMVSAEGAWAKRAYRKLSNDFQIPWSSKKDEDQSKKNPITFLNFLTYSIADIAIYHLGFDPNIGILHGRTKGGGLSYDLADIVKPILALVPSFISRQKSYTLSKIKSEFILDVIRFDIIDYLIKTLEMLFPKEQKEE